MRTTILPTPRGEFGARVTEPPKTVARRTPVVCVHGFPDDASTFDAVAARLAAHGHPVTSVYLRGYAPSPTEGDFSIPALAEDVGAIAREVGAAEPVVLLAHDYGAQIAYAALSEYPDLFLAAVLLSVLTPPPFPRTPGVTPVRFG